METKDLISPLSPDNRPGFVIFLSASPAKNATDAGPRVRSTEYGVFVNFISHFVGKRLQLYSLSSGCIDIVPWCFAFPQLLDHFAIALRTCAEPITPSAQFKH